MCTYLSFRKVIINFWSSLRLLGIVLLQNSGFQAHKSNYHKSLDKCSDALAAVTFLLYSVAVWFNKFQH